MVKPLNYVGWVCCVYSSERFRERTRRRKSQNESRFGDKHRKTEN